MERTCVDCSAVLSLPARGYGSIRRCPSCQREAKRQRARVNNLMPGSKFSRLKLFARQRHIPVEVTRQEFDALAGLPCFYCGGITTDSGSGVDRVDSNLPYRADNLVPSCSFCNHLKSLVFTTDEMKRIGAVVAAIRAEREAVGLPLGRDYRPYLKRLAA